ncbi:AlpA family phage regulatory protein [Geotalea sp. SG265]|uniref:helix-turn-helix transcriptional regulator n=1 Tax=Geotalea sp. SG265 TaxID=2922867 RepID=UPI00325FBB6C
MTVESFVRPKDLKALTGLSRTTVWRLEKKGEFPQRRQLSEGAVGYLLSEVRAWMSSRCPA